MGNLIDLTVFGGFLAAPWHVTDNTMHKISKVNYFTFSETLEKILENRISSETSKMVLPHSAWCC
jgi:hypothetical protein